MYPAPSSGLAYTGAIGVTVGGHYLGAPIIATLAIGLVLVGAIMIRLSFRRGKTVGER